MTLLQQNISTDVYLNGSLQEPFVRDDEEDMEAMGQEVRQIRIQDEIARIHEDFSAIREEFVGIDTKGVKGPRTYYLLEGESAPDAELLESVRSRLDALLAMEPGDDAAAEIAALEDIHDRLASAKTITRQARQALHWSYGGIWSEKFDRKPIEMP